MWYITLMALTVLLLPLTFLLLCLVIAGQEREENDPEPAWQVVVLQAAVLWGVLLAALSYGLSLLTSLNRLGLSLGWGAALTGLALVGWRGGRLRGGWVRVRGWLGGLGRLPRAEQGLLAVVGGLALVLLVVALMAPPNTNDSMRYHLARVMHWQQNQSLAHYPTPIEAQLWMPPWAELAILHLVVLEGSDRLANLVQWLAMLGSLAGVAWIARRLGARTAGQVAAVVTAFTIPMGILQATSTQNDYVTAFWAVCLAVFVLRDLGEQGLESSPVRSTRRGENYKFGGFWRCFTSPKSPARNRETPLVSRTGRPAAAASAGGKPGMPAARRG